MWKTEYTNRGYLRIPELIRGDQQNLRIRLWCDEFNFVSVPIVKPSLYIYHKLTNYDTIYKCLCKKESQNSKSSDKFIFRF